MNAISNAPTVTGSTRRRSRLIRRPEVQEITGISRSGIYARIDSDSPGFDPTFPKPVNLGGRSVGWVLDEIEIWVDQRVAARDSAKGVATNV